MTTAAPNPQGSPAPPPSLGQAASALAAELRAQAEDRAQDWGPVAALHALILATLARLVTRLAAMIADWQAGLLAPPAERPQAARQHRAIHAPRARRHAGPRARRRGELRPDFHRTGELRPAARPHPGALPGTVQPRPRAIRAARPLHPPTGARDRRQAAAG